MPSLSPSPEDFPAKEEAKERGVGETGFALDPHIRWNDAEVLDCIVDSSRVADRYASDVSTDSKVSLSMWIHRVMDKIRYRIPEIEEEFARFHLRGATNAVGIVMFLITFEVFILTVIPGITELTDQRMLHPHMFIMWVMLLTNFAYFYFVSRGSSLPATVAEDRQRANLQQYLTLFHAVLFAGTTLYRPRDRQNICLGTPDAGLTPNVNMTQTVRCNHVVDAHMPALYLITGLLMNLRLKFVISLSLFVLLLWVIGHTVLMPHVSWTLRAEKLAFYILILPVPSFVAWALESAQRKRFQQIVTLHIARQAIIAGTATVATVLQRSFPPVVVKRLLRSPNPLKSVIINETPNAVIVAVQVADYFLWYSKLMPFEVVDVLHLALLILTGMAKEKGLDLLISGDIMVFSSGLFSSKTKPIECCNFAYEVVHRPEVVAPVEDSPAAPFLPSPLYPEPTSFEEGSDSIFEAPTFELMPPVTRETTTMLLWRETQLRAVVVTGPLRGEISKTLVNVSPKYIVSGEGYDKALRWLNSGNESVALADHISVSNHPSSILSTGPLENSWVLHGMFSDTPSQISEETMTLSGMSFDIHANKQESIAALLQVPMVPPQDETVWYTLNFTEPQTNVEYYHAAEQDRFSSLGILTSLSTVLFITAMLILYFIDRSLFNTGDLTSGRDGGAIACLFISLGLAFFRFGWCVFAPRRGDSTPHRQYERVPLPIAVDILTHVGCVTLAAIATPLLLRQSILREDVWYLCFAFIAPTLAQTLHWNFWLAAIVTVGLCVSAIMAVRIEVSGVVAPAFVAIGGVTHPVALTASYLLHRAARHRFSAARVATWHALAAESRKSGAKMILQTILPDHVSSILYSRLADIPLRHSFEEPQVTPEKTNAIAALHSTINVVAHPSPVGSPTPESGQAEDSQLLFWESFGELVVLNVRVENSTGFVPWFLEWYNKKKQEEQPAGKAGYEQVAFDHDPDTETRNPFDLKEDSETVGQVWACLTELLGCVCSEVNSRSLLQGVRFVGDTFQAIGPMWHARESLGTDLAVQQTAAAAVTFAQLLTSVPPPARFTVVCVLSDSHGAVIGNSLLSYNIFGPAPRTANALLQCAPSLPHSYAVATEPLRRRIATTMYLKESEKQKFDQFVKQNQLESGLGMSAAFLLSRYVTQDCRELQHEKIFGEFLSWRVRGCGIIRVCTILGK